MMLLLLLLLLVVVETARLDDDAGLLPLVMNGCDKTLAKRKNT